MVKYIGWFIYTLMLAVITSTTLVNGQWNPKNPYVDENHWWNTKDISVVWSWENKKDSFLNVVKWAINWVLGILALIALIILMYWGFQMVTSAGDEDKYSAWFTILKHAAQWLILIWIARFVISIIFWLVNQVTKNAPPANSWW
jgi:hypothetical protein